MTLLFCSGALQLSLFPLPVLTIIIFSVTQCVCSLPVVFHFIMSTLLSSPNITLASEVFPAASLPSNVPICSPLLCLSLTLTHTLIPLSFAFCKCCVLQSSLLPRVQRSSHQADYALSFNLSALFVPPDHSASTQTNPLFVQGSLIYSDQNCTLHHKRLRGMSEKY